LPEQILFEKWMEVKMGTAAEITILRNEVGYFLERRVNKLSIREVNELLAVKGESVHAAGQRAYSRL
jgi:hypothetical protein